MVARWRHAVLGLSVGRSRVHAVLLAKKAIQWVGQAEYAGSTALSEVVARLAAESGRPVRRARVVLERAVVQLRTVAPAPPLPAGRARHYVALEAARLFRKNGEELVTDATLVAVDSTGLALWAAAASEPLVRAILEGGARADLRIETLGPSADVLPHAVHLPVGVREIAIPNGNSSEVLSLGRGGTWRSRFVPGVSETAPEWTAAVAALGADATHFAPAYAAAAALPRLDLLPRDARAARDRTASRRRLQIAALGVTFWAFAGLVSVGRLLWTLHTSVTFLHAVAPVLDSALAQRRDLDVGQSTLATIAAAATTRSRYLPLMGAVSAALSDSVFLVAVRIGSDRTVHLAGYAPSATRVVADLERVPELRDAKLESPVTREAPAGHPPLDRFSVVAHLGGGP